MSGKRWTLGVPGVNLPEQGEPTHFHWVTPTPPCNNTCAQIEVVPAAELDAALVQRNEWRELCAYNAERKDRYLADFDAAREAYAVECESHGDTREKVVALRADLDAARTQLADAERALEEAHIEATELLGECNKLKDDLRFIYDNGLDKVTSAAFVLMKSERDAALAREKGLREAFAFIETMDVWDQSNECQFCGSRYKPKPPRHKDDCAMTIALAALAGGEGK